MTEEPKTVQLSEQDQRVLEHLALAAILFQQKLNPATKPERRPWWKPFLEPSVLTALVTVLIGGIMGNLIAAQIQAGAKDREFNQAWLKARGDQALLAYKEYLDQEQQVVRRAYELVGSCVAASDDLIRLTGAEFARGSHEGVEQQRREIRKTYNAQDATWRKGRLELQLLVDYYHSQSAQEIGQNWRQAHDAVTSYMDCAANWYLDYEDKTATPDQINVACKDQRKSVEDLMRQFTVSLEQTRRYAWEGWESPARLKSALD